MNDQIIAAAAARELEAESASTTKCLERIPFELFGYKPHPRSMELGYLVTLISEIPYWITYIITKGDIDFATFEHYQPKNTQDVVDRFHRNVAEAKEALLSVTDGELDKEFSLKSKGELLMKSTKREQVEQSINHMVHHRGQLTVYMRLNEIAVPSIYGPSADDKNYQK